MTHTNSNKNLAKIAGAIAAGLILLVGAGIIAYFCLIPRQTEILVPIQWDARPGLIVLEPSATSLLVKVSGSRRELFALAKAKTSYIPGLLHASDDAVAASDGVVSMSVESDEVLVPKGIKILSMTPSRLYFRVEKQIKKKVFVIVALAGQPASGYTITQMHVAPDRMTLRGPKSILDNMETVYTMPVDISRANDVITQEAPLALCETVDKATKKKTVVVTVVVEKEKAIRRITVPVLGKNPPKKFTIMPLDIELLVRGPIQTLDNLPKSGEVAAWVDLKGMGRGVYARRATIALPLSIILQDASPEVFTVTIK